MHGETMKYCIMLHLVGCTKKNNSKELFVPIFYLEDGSHKFSETVDGTALYRRP